MSSLVWRKAITIFVPRKTNRKSMAQFTDEEIEERLEGNKRIYDEHFDTEYCEAMISNALHILMDIYFRSEKIGFDEELMERNNPDAPVIVISNHSGMSFPWDGIIFLAQTLREKGYRMDDVPRPLVAPVLSQTRLMNPFMIPDFWKKCGGVDASFLNFETMMHYPSANVMLFPEGVPGIGKGFDNKYQMTRFATSFVRMALKYKTDIVPFVTINGEYLNPYTYSFEWINKWVRKVSLPFLPMGILSPFLLILPWLFYFSFPSKLSYIRCRRIKLSDLADKEYEDLSKEEIETLTSKVQVSMQEDMDKYVKEYGKNPYQRKELYRKVWKNMKYFPFMFPIAWPVLFEEFERQWKRFKKTGKPIKMEFGFFAPLLFILRNPISICYYIPILGWIPLLIRGYGKGKY